MFIRLVTDSFTRRPRHKLLTGSALALGMALVTAALSVALDVGDRLAREFRSLGANLVVTPEADSLPLEIGGVDYRPANAGAYLPETDLSKLKTIFWHLNIMGFSPTLEVPVTSTSVTSSGGAAHAGAGSTTLLGTWSEHHVLLPGEMDFVTGVEKINPWWTVRGRWFAEASRECVVGTALAKRNGLKIADTIHVANQGGDQSLTLEVTGILSSGGPEDNFIVVALPLAQQLASKTGQYRKLYVSALTKPEDDFGRRDPSTLTPQEFDRWYCTPYISSIASQIHDVLPGSDVRVIRRVAEGEGTILLRVRSLLWLVTFAALLAAALAVGASSAAAVIERRTEIGLMKALGAGSGTVGFLLAAEQLLLAFWGGGVGYALGLLLARLVGLRVFGAAPHPSLLVLGLTVALAGAVTLLGSAVPLRRAARYDPAPILRGE